MMKLILRKPFLFFLSLFVIVAYQNCIEVGFTDKSSGGPDSSTESPSTTPDDKTPGAGNGEGYGGKDPIGAFFVYNFVDKCSDASDPHPYVTDTISLDENDKYFLTKEDCIYLSQPRLLNDSDITIDNNNPLLLFYLDTVFEGNPEGGTNPPAENDANSQLIFHCSSQVFVLNDVNVRYVLEVRREDFLTSPPNGVRKLRAKRIENKAGSLSTSSSSYRSDRDIVITNPTGMALVTTWSYNDASPLFDLRILATNGDPDRFKVGTFQGTVFSSEPEGSQFDVSCFSTPSAEANP